MGKKLIECDECKYFDLYVPCPKEAYHEHICTLHKNKRAHEVNLNDDCKDFSKVGN